MASTTHEGADAPESTQTTNARIEYSTEVVHLGNIVPPTLEEGATPGLISMRDKDLDNETFADSGASDLVVDALEDQGIICPFSIRALTLPLALEHHGIIGQTKVDTGKALGFAAPALGDVIAPDEGDCEELLSPGHPQALIILLARELTKQAAADLCSAAKYLLTRTADVYGSVAFELQIETPERNANIVAGTPGRLIDLLRKGVLHLDGAETVILGEADETFGLGFLPDVRIPFSRVPSCRYTILLFVTIPGLVVTLVCKFMEHPTHIHAQDPGDQSQAVNSVKQIIYRVYVMNKIEVVVRIPQSEGRGRSVVFCWMKRTATYFDENLSTRGFAAGSLHGDLGQGACKQVLRAFRKGKVDVFVVMDVATRGTDVDDVTHVTNYQCPEDKKIHIHRVGCIGRAGSPSTAVTFVGWGDTSRWFLISKALDLGVSEPLETYHTSAHLFIGLDIPEGTTRRLPRVKRTTVGLSAEKLRDLGGPSSCPRGCRPGDRGVVVGKGSRRRHRGERNHEVRDGDRETRAGQRGRSDRGARRRGRGNHSQTGVEVAPQTPCKRIHRREPQTSERSEHLRGSKRVDSV